MEKVKKETVVPLPMKEKEIVVKVIIEIVPPSLASPNMSLKADLKTYMAAVKSAREELEEENAELRVAIEKLRRDLAEKEAAEGDFNGEF